MKRAPCEPKSPVPVRHCVSLFAPIASTVLTPAPPYCGVESYDPTGNMFR